VLPAKVAYPYLSVFFIFYLSTVKKFNDKRAFANDCCLLRIVLCPVYTLWAATHISNYLSNICQTKTMIMNTANFTGNAVIFNYQQEDYEKWVKTFADQINARQLEDRIQYPAEIATGYAMAKIVEPGLSYRVVNYTLNTDFEYRRTPIDEFRLMLYFYELKFENKAVCKVNNRVIEATDKFFSVALMTNSNTNLVFKMEKGTTVRGLSIEMNEEWLKQNFKDFSPAKLTAVKAKECVVDFITAKQRKILADVFGDNKNTQFPELYVKSRVLRLTEQFLTTLCSRGLSDIPDYINQKDFQALQKIEHSLLTSYCGEFPSIESLAKMAYMSASKLKKLFKKAYGMAPYEYYQKNRMHKAKELLTVKKQSVSQVGAFLGYQNMSNFSAAFKKEFNFLPSQAHEVM
jgi:AraC-like DNA-binding protein